MTTLVTDSSGYTDMVQVPADTTINFTVSKSGYNSVSDSVLIDYDKEITVTMIEVGVGAGVSLKTIGIIVSALGIAGTAVYLKGKKGGG